MGDGFAAIRDAAEQGRIDKLLIGTLRYTTDTVRDNTEPVPVITFPEPEPSQAIHDIASRVWNASGTIIPIDQAKLAHLRALPMLATYRY